MYRNNRLKFVFRTRNILINGRDDNIITLDNCRANVKITNGGIAMGGNAEFTIYGLSGDLIASLCKVGGYTRMKENMAEMEVEIYANDSLAYSGGVYYVNANMNEVPTVGINFRSAGGYDLSVSNAPDYAFKGTRTLSEILKGICEKSGYTFVDRGVTGTQTNGYYSGSPLKQIRDLCANAILSYAISGKTVTAWNKIKNKVAETRALVSAENGLIGYPVYTPDGLTIQTQYSPYIAQGEQLRLETSLPGASGDYAAYLVTHYLTSWEKNGAWHTVAVITPFVPEKEKS
ncbi:baseplate hub protein [Morganella morganii]|uniref:baseplate hub protein n=1 Tax=Morganella morganii TaxID=582 RepID=UPI00069B4296|nr:hypothetical protein [Morganella morganii]KNZ84053.1 hypothetical protein AKG16_18885 [Morganella morganii]